MVFVRTILGSLIGAAINLLVFRLLPFTPDLSDWGGRSFPRSYIVPLLIVAVVSYITGWIAAKFSPVTGRLCGMLAALITGALVIGWDIGADILEPLFHHPAYPVFSDQTLLALALLLVGGHLGGARVERTAANVTENNTKVSN